MKISIEGIPGSGKTTILRILKKMGYCTNNRDTINDLKLIESSSYVFKKVLERATTTTKHLWIEDRQIRDDEHEETGPDVIIFLDCPPDIAIKRLKQAKSKSISALQVTDIYLELEWVFHPVNCDIAVFKVNASGTIFHTLHNILAVLNEFKG